MERQVRNEDTKDDLHEREAELGALAEALAAARAGTGRLIVVAGPAGIGKSRLLAEVRATADAMGMTVLTARGIDLETDASFGVATQLFTETARRARLLTGHAALATALFDPSVPLAEDPSALVRGLYWLTVNTASAGEGTLITVDDAQWADRPSLAYLAYLAARIDELKAVLVIALRSGEPSADQQVIDRLSADGQLLRPSRLSPRAVARMVHADFSAAGPALAEACAEAGGGNPFLISELLRALRAGAAEGTVPTASQARSLVPDSVLRSVLIRLERLGEPAGRLARAVAIVGDGAPMRRARLLAGLDAGPAEMAADALASAHIMAPGEPLCFSHPLIAASVYADIPAFARARAHREAADLLAGDGAPLDGVAAHLLLSPAEGDQRTVATLREAAARALARGDSVAAAHLLTRALAEPPPLAERADVLLELADAEIEHGASTVGPHIEEALHLIERPAGQVRALAALGRLRFNLGEHEAAARAMEEALELLDPDDPGYPALLGNYLTATTFRTGLHPLGMARLRPVIEAARDGRLPGDPGLLAHLTLRLAFAAEPAERIRALAERATAADPLVDPASLGILNGLVIQALCCVDELGAAERISDAAVATARRRGSLLSFTMASYQRAVGRYHRGELTSALADLDQALTAARDGFTAGNAWSGGMCVHIHVERGDLAAARDVLPMTDAAAPGSMDLPIAMFARARLALAEGRPDAALADAEEAGRLLGTGFGIDHPGFVPWRRTAAKAAHALGQADRARDLADQMLERARWTGTPRAIGLALRTQAALANGEPRIELLAEAADVLARSPSTLECAHVLVALGAARSRAGYPVAAKPPLREALQLADRMGAAPLVQAARRELHTLGVRPRRPAATGLGSLTPTERRVAELVASGLSNRQAAEALFVTVRTVETHLARAYQKLGISSRTDLAKRLPPAS